MYKHLTRVDLVNLLKLKLEFKVHIDLIKLLEIGELDSKIQCRVNSSEFPKSFKTLFQ